MGDRVKQKKEPKANGSLGIDTKRTGLVGLALFLGGTLALVVAFLGAGAHETTVQLGLSGAVLFSLGQMGLLLTGLGRLDARVQKLEAQARGEGE